MSLYHEAAVWKIKTKQKQTIRERKWRRHKIKWKTYTWIKRVMLRKMSDVLLVSQWVRESTRPTDQNGWPSMTILSRQKAARVEWAINIILMGRIKSGRAKRRAEEKEKKNRKDIRKKKLRKEWGFGMGVML